VAGPPIADGAILIDTQGKIVAVGQGSEVPRPPDALTEHLHGAALLPGFVNTHTHLELTGFAGQVDDDDFWDWIRHLMSVKAARSEEAFFDAARDGIRAGWHAGVTTVCDTGSTGQVIAALDSLDASGISHHEVFGMHPEQCDAAMKGFSRSLDRLARHATGRVQLGVSPHAPYTVSGPLYRAAANLARAHGVPIAVHVAEAADESALLRDFTGSFAEMWSENGVPRPTAIATTPVEWLDGHGVLGPRTLCIHVIHATDSDVDLLARHQCAIAHCPRSNRRHHHADAPLQRFIEQRLRVGLGTDSEVSVAPLDLVAEARAARTLAGWDARETLRALTLGGAEAVDLAATTGSLVAGKWGDVTAIAIGNSDSPEESILASAPGDVVGTWLGGRDVGAARPDSANTSRASGP